MRRRARGREINRGGGVYVEPGRTAPSEPACSEMTADARAPAFARGVGGCSARSQSRAWPLILHHTRMRKIRASSSAGLSSSASCTSKSRTTPASLSGVTFRSHSLHIDVPSRQHGSFDIDIDTFVRVASLHTSASSTARAGTSAASAASRHAAKLGRRQLPTIHKLVREPD